MKNYKEIKKTFAKYIEELKVDLKAIDKNGVYTFIKKRYKLLASITTVCVALGIIVIVNKEPSLEKALSSLEKGLIEGDASEVAKYLRVEEEKVQAVELEPLLKKYKDNSKDVQVIIERLEMYNETGDFSWVVEDKLFGKDAYINLEKVELKIDIENEKDIDLNKLILKIDDKVIRDFSKPVDVIQGIHKLEYVYGTSFGDVKETKEIVVDRTMKSEIEVDIRYITLYTEFKDATVYINGKAIDKKAGEIEQYGPLPKNEEFEVYIEKEYPWGAIKSESVILDDSDYLNLAINMANDELMINVKDKTNEFYSSVFQGLNNQDENNIINCTDEVKSKIYNYMEKEYLFFKNDYEIGELEVNIEKSEFKDNEEGYTANVVTKVDYTIDKSWIPFTKKEYSKYFLLAMTYEVNGWNIDEIQEFDIENLD